MNAGRLFVTTLLLISIAAFAEDQKPKVQPTAPVLLTAACTAQCDSTFETCKKGCQTGDCMAGCARGYEGCKKRCSSSGGLDLPFKQAALRTCAAASSTCPAQLGR